MKETIYIVEKNGELILEPWEWFQCKPPKPAVMKARQKEIDNGTAVVMTMTEYGEYRKVAPADRKIIRKR